MESGSGQLDLNLEGLTRRIEAISSRYAAVFGFNRTQEWFLLKLQEEVGELTQTYLMMMKQARQKGLSSKDIEKKFAHEIADVLCQVLLIAHHTGVDIKAALDEKWFKFEDPKNWSPL